MKFSVLVAILPEELEQQAIDLTRAEGAGGITIMTGRGIASENKRTFFGLTFEGSQSVMVLVLEKKLSLQVLKSIQSLLTRNLNSKGVVFTLPVEHLAGIDLKQIAQFEQHIKDEI